MTIKNSVGKLQKILAINYDLYKFLGKLQKISIIEKLSKIKNLPFWKFQVLLMK